MPKTCPTQAGVYRNVAATGKYAYILVEYSHPYSYYVMDAFRCDCHGKIQEGNEFAVPFAAEQFGEMVKPIEEEWL